METNDNERSVHFIYQAASGNTFEVEGWFTPPALEQRHGRGFMINSRIIQPQRRNSIQKHFVVSDEFVNDITSICSNQLHGFKNQYEAALRRLAVSVTKNELDADTFNDNLFLITLENDGIPLLQRYLHKECQHQDKDEMGNLFCLADPSQRWPTTIMKCEKCPMPDQWKRCRHITHVRVIPTATAKDPADCIITAMCQLEKKPGENGRLPEHCRAEVASCFEPNTIPAPKSQEKNASETAETVFNRLNPLWKKAHGFFLFIIPSTEPLNALSADCSNAGEFRDNIFHLTEILKMIDVDSLQKEARVDLDETNKGHTLKILEAFITTQGYPEGKKAIEDLRNVQNLRSLPPVHTKDGAAPVKAEKALSQLGFRWPVSHEDWPSVWKATLFQFRKGLYRLLLDTERLQ